MTLGRAHSNLLVLAKAQGYFAEEGLEVELLPAANGWRSIDALSPAEVAPPAVGGADGKPAVPKRCCADLAVAGDPAVAFAAYEHPSLAVLGTIAEHDQHFTVLSRRGRGIESPKDLKGKKIGTGQMASNRYFLQLYLAKHGLSDADVSVVVLGPAKLPAALAAGEIDAIAGPLKGRFVRNIKKMPGTEIVELKDPAVHRLRVNLLSSKEVLASKPDLAPKVMRALDKAADFARDHREETVRAVAQASGVEGKVVAQAFRRFTYELGLDEALVRSLEDEGRWYAAKRPAKTATAAPSWAALIAPEALQSVRPEAVRLGR